MSRGTVASDGIARHAEEQVEQYGIGIVPISFYSDDRVYKDWLDINPSQARRLFFDAPQYFRTPAALLADCREIYCQAVHGRVPLLAMACGRVGQNQVRVAVVLWGWPSIPNLDQRTSSEVEKS